MKKDYYKHKPPNSKELQSMFYRVTTVDKQTVEALKHIFLDGNSNNVRDVMLKHTQYYRICSMAKPAIALYGYHINNPHRHEHDTDYIVAWMLRYARNVLLDYDNYNQNQDEYYHLPNKFVTRHKEYLLTALERDARIVARKANDIESQRKH